MDDGSSSCVPVAELHSDMNLKYRFMFGYKMEK